MFFEKDTPGSLGERLIRETEPLFLRGKNGNLKLTSKGIDKEGRLWARGIFSSQDGREISVVGFLGSIGPEEGLPIMVFGWVITEVNGIQLDENKYILSDVREIDEKARSRILSKAALGRVMIDQVGKSGKTLVKIPEISVYHHPKLPSKTMLIKN